MSIRYGGAPAAALTVTITAEVMVSVEELDLVVSVTDVAVIMTVLPDGTAWGAVYSAPVRVMEPIVPTVALPFGTPSTVQVTFGLGFVVSITVSETWSVALMLTEVLAGVIETLTDLIVTVAFPAKYFLWPAVMWEETAKI